MLSEIASRLRDECAALREVQGLAALSQLRGDPPMHLIPAGYVVPLDEVPDANATTGAVMQQVRLRFGVVLMVSGQADDVSGEAVGTLTAVRRQVLSALLGWPPSGAEEGMTFGGGELMGAAAGTLRWMDIFETTTVYRS